MSALHVTSIANDEDVFFRPTNKRGYQRAILRSGTGRSSERPVGWILSPWGTAATSCFGDATSEIVSPRR
jgi:hypothetical protein